MEKIIKETQENKFEAPDAEIVRFSDENQVLTTTSDGIELPEDEL